MGSAGAPSADETKFNKSTIVWTSDCMLKQFFVPFLCIPTEAWIFLGMTIRPSCPKQSSETQAGRDRGLNYGKFGNDGTAGRAQ
jgi:hypothetical protein